jgi:hypothetical protein
MFPYQLLDKVYIPKSLKITPAGFEFTLRNIVDSGTLIGVRSLTVDGHELALHHVTINTPTGSKRADEISYQNPLPLRYYAEAVISATDYTLTAGTHQIALSLSVAEAGKVYLHISDEIA